MIASACVSGSTLANAASAAGIAPIGKSEPAKNHGTIATAGNAPTYSSCDGMRLASVSATPYMTTTRPMLAARNHAIPVAVPEKSAPRRTAAPISTASWRPLTARAPHRCRDQVPPGAAVAFDEEADARQHAVEGQQQPDGGDGDEAHVVDAADGRDLVGERRGDDEREQDRRQQRYEQLSRSPDVEREPAPHERAQRVGAPRGSRGSGARGPRAVERRVDGGHGVLLCQAVVRRRPGGRRSSGDRCRRASGGGS